MDYDIGIVRRRTIISADDCYFAVPAAGGAATPATWDPLHKTNSTLSGGNLTATAAATAAFNTFSNVANTTNQKVYFEIAINTVFGAIIGMSSDNTSVNRFDTAAGSPTKGFVVLANGVYNCFDSADHAATAIALFGTGDNVDVAYDDALKRVWFRKNNAAWNTAVAGTQNPATGQGGLIVNAGSGPFFAFIGDDANAGDNLTATFAAASWTRTAPSGFTQLAA